MSMKDLKKYLKYYSQEDYIFGEISRNYKKRGYLTPEEFFMVVIWKSNRTKTKVRKEILDSGKTIRTITSNVARAKTPAQKLSILTSIFGIGIPVASAILAVCYPDDFTVADYRVRESLRKLGENIADPTSTTRAYLAYVDLCKKLAGQTSLSLRDFDRSLWGRDYYEGTGGLKQLVDGLS